MPYISAWFHLVWSTKNRQPFLTEDIREKVFEHVRQYAKQKGIWLDQVNGHKDHVHCLLSLSCDQTLSKVLQLIKGESSYWINKEKLCKEKFVWQDEYFAMSLSVTPAKRKNLYQEPGHSPPIKNIQGRGGNFTKAIWVWRGGLAKKTY